MKRIFALTALALFALAAPAAAQDTALRYLTGRVDDLERRVVALEALETRAVPRSPAAPASFAPQAGYPQAQQRYTVDAGGVYWPAGAVPAASYGVPAAYYGGGSGQPVSPAYTFGGGFGDAGGGCAGGNCGGGSAAGGYRFAPFGGAFRRR